MSLRFPNVKAALESDRPPPLPAPPCVRPPGTLQWGPLHHERAGHSHNVDLCRRARFPVAPDLAGNKRDIARDYEISAAKYARYADPLVYRYVTAPLATVLADVSGPILEIASGTGALGRQLINVVAFDLVREQLLQNPIARRVQADVDHLPFRANSFAVTASAFGMNHFPDPYAAIAEMARVAPVVAVITWQRPETPFPPKQIVLEVIEHLAGRARTRAGEIIEELSQAIGTQSAISDVLSAASLRPEVEIVEAEVPWPGTQAFIDYRLSMSGVVSLIDADEVRRVATREIDALPQESLVWRPRLVLGVGRREPV